MKLMTKEIENKIPRLYSQENVKDPTVWVKFFPPWGSWSWYAIEYDPEQELCFGWVDGDFPELGYFSLKELKEIRGIGGLSIERDKYFTPKPLSEVMNK